MAEKAVICVWEVTLSKVPLIVLVFPLLRPVRLVVLSLLHEKEFTPLIDLPSVIAKLTLSPLHISAEFGVITACGIGFAVIVKFFVLPRHVIPAFVKDGVIVIVPDIDVLPVFVTVNASILPVPLVAKPIEVFVFVQL